MLSDKKHINKNSQIDIILCLISLLIMSAFYYGIRALMVSMISIFTCIICEAVYSYVMVKKIDINLWKISVTGLAFSLLMPASVPFDILVISCVIMMFIGSYVFGGESNPLFSKIAVGYCFASICWKQIIMMYPQPVSLWQKSFFAPVSQIHSHSLAYYLNMGNVPVFSFPDIIMGKFLGPMGTTHVFLLVLCMIILLLKKSVSVTVVTSSLLTFIFFAVLFPVIPGKSIIELILFELVGGYTIFGILLISYDDRLLPDTNLGRFLWGILIALLTIVFRRYAKLEQGIFFAIIIANVLNTTVDSLGVVLMRIVNVVTNTFGVVFRRKRKFSFAFSILPRKQFKYKAFKKEKTNCFSFEGEPEIDDGIYDFDQENKKNSEEIIEEPSEKDIEETVEEYMQEEPSEENIEETIEEYMQEEPSEENIEETIEEYMQEEPSEENIEETIEEYMQEEPSEEDIEETIEEYMQEEPSEEDIEETVEEYMQEEVSQEDIEESNKQDSQIMFQPISETQDEDYDDLEDQEELDSDYDEDNELFKYYQSIIKKNKYNTSETGMTYEDYLDTTSNQVYDDIENENSIFDEGYELDYDYIVSKFDESKKDSYKENNEVKEKISVSSNNTSYSNNKDNSYSNYLINNKNDVFSNYLINSNNKKEYLKQEENKISDYIRDNNNQTDKSVVLFDISMESDENIKNEEIYASNKEE